MNRQNKVHNGIDQELKTPLLGRLKEAQYDPNLAPPSSEELDEEELDQVSGGEGRIKVQVDTEATELTEEDLESVCGGKPQHRPRTFSL
jgi:bacteriocin-like protein